MNKLTKAEAKEKAIQWIGAVAGDGSMAGAAANAISKIIDAIDAPEPRFKIGDRVADGCGDEGLITASWYGQMHCIEGQEWFREEDLELAEEGDSIPK